MRSLKWYRSYRLVGTDTTQPIAIFAHNTVAYVSIVVFACFFNNLYRNVWCRNSHVSIRIKESNMSVVSSSPLSPLNFKEKVTSSHESTQKHITANCIRTSIINAFTPPHFLIYVFISIYRSTKM